MHCPACGPLVKHSSPMGTEPTHSVQAEAEGSGVAKTARGMEGQVARSIEWECGVREGSYGGRLGRL